MSEPLPSKAAIAKVAHPKWSGTQQDEFELAVLPLIKWLNNNCHPHTQVVVDCVSAELFEGQMRMVNKTFIKD
jgi:hypothetical protein